jgi:hypothetical protein
MVFRTSEVLLRRATEERVELMEQRRALLTETRSSFLYFREVTEQRRQLRSMSVLPVTDSAYLGDDLFDPETPV